jgi:hypothetical protein
MEYPRLEIEDFVLEKEETDEGMELRIIYKDTTYSCFVESELEEERLGSRLATNTLDFVKTCLTTGRPYGVKVYLVKATIYSFTPFEEVLYMSCSYTSGEISFCYDIELVRN